MQRSFALISSLTAVIFLAACGANNTNRTEQATPLTDTSVIPCIDTVAADSATEDIDYATYFVVIADTGLDYYPLDQEMYTLSKQLSIPIDTTGNYYNKTKNKIVLPENDEDEIYAGEYYPRRFASETLSLEYLSFYNEQSDTNTIALVRGLYAQEQSADSVLTALKQTAGHAFKVKANLYVGCIH